MMLKISSKYINIFLNYCKLNNYLFHHLIVQMDQMQNAFSSIVIDALADKTIQKERCDFVTPSNDKTLSIWLL